MGLITQEAREWATGEFPSREFSVTARDIQKYSFAVGESDPVHFDPEAARAAGYRDVVAPPLFPYVIRMQAYGMVPTGDLEPDGSTADDVPPVPTRRAMAGETVIELGVPVVAGDVVTVDKRIADLYEKEGRSGPLVFVEMEFTFRNQNDELVARERFTRIYR
jgi:hydroxyacyl-ACP dehydratase HTD2-like protein with hotdog domain